MTDENLLNNKLAFLIGTIMGQLSEILNQINSSRGDNKLVYESLLDVHRMAAMQVHHIFYKEKE